MYLQILRWFRRQGCARPLLFVAVWFLIGLLLEEYFRWSLKLLLPVSGMALLVTLALRRRFRLAAMLCLWMFVLLLGAMRFEMAILQNPDIETQFSVNFTGVVDSDPVYNQTTERIICEFQLTSIEGESTDARVRLYLRSDIVELEGVEYGQTLTCFGHIWPQDHATNPHEFDMQNWLRSERMTGMAAAKLEDVKIEPAPPSIWRNIVSLRHAISNRIEMLFPNNTALVRAFVLGDRSTLTDELTDSFQSTGITHLICISGMHISVLAMVLSVLLSHILPRNSAIYTTLALLVCYCSLIGFPPSLVRASIMFALFSLAPVAGRLPDSMTRISVALLGMLIVNPFYIYSSGFVLSFVASTGIILLTPTLESLFHVDVLKAKRYSLNRWRRKLERMVRYFPTLLCTTLAAQISTLPAIAAYFGKQPLLSIPVNLLTVPLAMIAYPLSLVALCLSVVFYPVGALFARIPDGMFSLLTHIVELFENIPIGQLQIPAFPLWLIAIHCILIIAASGLSGIHMRIRRFFPLPLMALAGISILNAILSAQKFQIIFFDAGQADSALLRTQGHVYLMDVGDPYTPADDYISGSCVNLDAIFLSHPHYDHAGGLEPVLKVMRPKIIYVPKGWFDMEMSEEVQRGIELAQELEIPIVELAVGNILKLSKDTTLTILAPETKNSDANAISLVFAVECGEASVLFTGDLLAEYEPPISPDVDILKVPHHGSDASSSEAFLAQVLPEVAIISVGDNNYGHPTAETLNRLKACGAEIYRTDQCGAITVTWSRAGSIQVRTYLSPEELHALE